jgi:hypothetical protein
LTDIYSEQESGTQEISQASSSPEDEHELPNRDKVPTDQLDPFPSWSDESSESSEADAEPERHDQRLNSSFVEQSKADVDSILDQIIRIGMLIRTSSAASRLNKADAYFGFEEFQNLGTLGYQHSPKLPTNDLLELKTHLLMCLFRRLSLSDNNDSKSYELGFGSELAKLEPAHREILNHLVYANLRRRNRFLYARRHGQKLAAAQNVLFLEWNKTRPTDEKAPADGSRPSITERATSAQKAGTPTLKSGTRVSTGRIELKDLENLTRRSQGQYALSRASVSWNKSGWPYAPKVSEERKTFQCPCCHLTLPVQESKDWYWK